ncbi:MAG TPA: nuclear transport factor 2 family protein [Candidatus Eisenbacteria bacterium]
MSRGPIGRDVPRAQGARNPHRDGAATWAEGACEPERFLVAGDRVLVFVDVRVRLNGKEDWIEGRAVDVFTFRDGKVIHWRTFAEAARALEWAGVPLDSSGA